MTKGDQMMAEICVKQLPDGQRVVTCHGRIVSLPMERSEAVRMADQLRTALESWASGDPNPVSAARASQFPMPEIVVDPSLPPGDVYLVSTRPRVKYVGRDGKSPSACDMCPATRGKCSSCESCVEWIGHRREPTDQR